MLRTPTKVHVPPSKRRYYDAHPVVSFRVSLKDREVLREVLETSGKSIGQFFREALGTAQRETMAAYKKGRREGFKKGIRKARELYRVHTLCPFCWEEIPVRGEELRGKAFDVLFKADPLWCHRKCIPPGTPPGTYEPVD